MTSFVPCEIVPNQQDVNNPFLDEILLTGSSSTIACILVYCIVTSLLEEVVYRGSNLRGKDFNLALQWHVMTKSGKMCGRRSFHIQKSRCSAYAYPATRKRTYKWSVKAIRRKTTRTGCMMYLRYVPRRFREGSQATPRNNGSAASV
ncbi:Uncharacterized protein Fot_25489 [Forsythia ovata]|uniref:Uncharacterized protein n=1 Tax=Forsythia ovata TaxID=205694 RepID=A0ABD1U956_9LAMI